MALLAGERLPLEVMERDELLFPGAARNVGVQAAKARYVAFLSSDCQATPHWAEERIAAHRAGARAVANAVVNSHPGSVVVWAGYLALFARRMPVVSPEEALAYGACRPSDSLRGHSNWRCGWNSPCSDTPTRMPTL